MIDRISEILAVIWLCLSGITMVSEFLAADKRMYRISGGKGDRLIADIRYSVSLNHKYL